VARYRSGDDRAAIAALESSMILSGGGDCSDWFFLAMTHSRLGDPEQARRWFDQAARWMDERMPRNNEMLRFREEAQTTLAKAGNR
jgi:hypothetical protein